MRDWQWVQLVDWLSPILARWTIFKLAYKLHTWLKTASQYKQCKRLSEDATWQRSLLSTGADRSAWLKSEDCFTLRAVLNVQWGCSLTLRLTFNWSWSFILTEDCFTLHNCSSNTDTACSVSRCFDRASFTDAFNCKYTEMSVRLSRFLMAHQHS